MHGWLHACIPSYALQQYSWLVPLLHIDKSCICGLHDFYSLPNRCQSTDLTIMEVPTSVNCFDRYKNELTSGLYNAVLVLYWQQERSSLLQTWNQKALCFIENLLSIMQEPTKKSLYWSLFACSTQFIYTYSSGGTGMGVGFLDPTFLVASLTPYGAEIKINIFIVSHWLKDLWLAQVRKLPRNTLVSSTMKY